MDATSFFLSIGLGAALYATALWAWKRWREAILRKLLWWLPGPQ